MKQKEGKIMKILLSKVSLQARVCVYIRGITGGGSNAVRVGKERGCAT